MSKKSEFINYVENLIVETNSTMPDNVRIYWEALKNGNNDEKPTFTDTGKLIMGYLKKVDGCPPLKSKDIADELLISSRAVAGAMRKLVNDNFVEKIGKDPILYNLTEQGRNIEIN